MVGASERGPEAPSPSTPKEQRQPDPRFLSFLDTWRDDAGVAIGEDRKRAISRRVAEERSCQLCDRRLHAAIGARGQLGEWSWTPDPRLDRKTSPWQKVSSLIPGQNPSIVISCYLTTWNEWFEAEFRVENAPVTSHRPILRSQRRRSIFRMVVLLSAQLNSYLGTSFHRDRKSVV